MKQITGNLWDFHDKGHWVGITTNGSIRKDGACVMGRGVAKEAADKFPELPYYLGNELKYRGNHVFAFPEQRIITLPVKHQWIQKADLELIRYTLGELIQLLSYPMVNIKPPIYLVRLGCGNGQLFWDDVEPLMERYLDDSFAVVERE